MKCYKTLLLIFTTLFLSNLLYSQVDTAWVRRYNGPGNSYDNANAIAVDSLGNVYVTGRSYGSGTNYDYTTIKYNSVGETLWVRRYNGPANDLDEATALTIDNLGNVYVTGKSGNGYTSDYATIKYNSFGETLWVRRYSRGTNRAKAIALDELGNVYVTGSDTDYATIKYNPTGETLWLRRYNGPVSYGDDEARAIAVDGSGNIYVTGWSWGDYATIKYNSAGETLWVRRYNGPGNWEDGATALAVDGSGNVYVTGRSNGSGTDYATIKYNPSGVQQWVARYNGPVNGEDGATALAVDSTGNVYVTGASTDPDSDYVTIKYNPTGETLWVRRYDGPSGWGDGATAITIDGSGNVYVTGWSEASGSAWDYATIKYNSSGVQQWVIRYNGSGNYYDEAKALAVDGSGNVYVTGRSIGSGTNYDYTTIKYVQYQYANDVGCTKIVAPTGVIDSGIVVTPACSVYNYGTNSANYRVRMRIGSFYNDTVVVTGHASNTYLYLTFPAWTASQLGTNIVRCSTELVGDERTSNDRRTDSVMVIASKDVGTIAILSPSGTIDSGAVITPQARVKNFGNFTVSFPVIFRIGTFYIDTGYVSDLNPNDSTIVSFGSWQAVQRGTHTTKCTTALTGDINPANDFLSGTVLVQVLDVGVSQIIAPTGMIDSGTVVIPQARVKNFGNTQQSFPVTFRISTFYNNTQNVNNLNPGESTLVSFAAWTASPRGTHTTKCTTALIGDQVPANNALTGSVTVQIRDVGVIQIIGPSGIIDSGLVVTPQARVKNFGTTAVTFPVTFRIGSFYANTQSVNNLNPGESTLVSFTAWTASPRGTHTTKCTTALTGDQNPSNNALKDSVTVRVVDVACLIIFAPAGTVDSGTVVIPVAQVRNNGTGSATFSVTFRIGAFYTNTRSKTLGSGITDTVGFAPWTANQVGTHTTKCTTALGGDLVPSNDAYIGSVSVQVGVIPDVGVTQIIAPVGTVDSGTAVTPQARVKNFGNTQQSFPVTFRISTFYNNARNVNNLNPGESTLVSFTAWTASPRGTHTTKCTTALTGDINPTNNALSESVLVRVHDVGITQLINPTGTIDSGTVVTPACSVYNYGTTSESYQVRMKIGNFYNDTAQILSHAPGTYQYIQFNTWTATEVGTHVVSCSTELGTDMLKVNDIRIDSVTVIVPGLALDVGVSKLISPTGWIDPGTVITPACSVYNFGNLTMSYPVRMKIGGFYNQVESVFGHIPGTSQYLTFPNWTATQIGMHWVKCSTKLDGDMQNTNDEIIGWVMVMQACPSWNKMEDITGATKPVKDGGCLTAIGDKVYGLVGNNTRDFMVYDINTYTWTKQGEVPFSATGRQKKVKRGACITNDGQYVYVIKGNNTQEFYRYDPSKDGWQELAQPGFFKRIKGGSMAYNGDSLIYLIGGSNRNEWKVYNINSGKWIDANPTTLPAEKWKYGSFIVYADSNIFALRVRSKTNEFYKLDLTSPIPQWQAVQSMPLYGSTGRKKKAKKGAAGAYDGNLIYALKGGNTLEYFSYNPITDSWQILDNVGNSIAIPTKRIKGGGSLIYSVAGKGFYGLVGNNTNEFWYYFPDTVTAAKMTSNVMADLNTLKTFSLQIQSNPSTNFINISYTLPSKAEAKIKLYNVIGNLVYQAKNDNGRFIINTERLTTGIYIAKFEAGDYKAIKKLIITR